MMDQRHANMEVVIQDLATNARISEYDCSCAVLAGDLKRAEAAAKRAKVFRDSLMKMAEQHLKTLIEEE